MTFENTNAIPGSLRRVWNYAGTPTSGTSGTFAGSAQPGDILSDTTNKKLYVNTNTAASPTWSQILTAGVAFAGDLDITGDIDLGGEDISVDQGRAIYLDGQDGGEFLVSDAANELTINATTTMNLAIGGTDEVSISATAVTIATNDLTLSAGDIAVAQGAFIYLDGQGGGEYIYSSGANELDINATTEINLRIGGTTEIALTASTLNINGVNVTVAADKFISGAPIKQTITAKTASCYLTTAESGVIRVTTDNVYVKLPTYVGNTGLTYTIKVDAAFAFGVGLYGGTDGGLIDGAATKMSTAVYDALTVIDNGAAWEIINKIGTWN